MTLYKEISVFFTGILIILSNLTFGGDGKVIMVYDNGFSGIVEDNQSQKLIQFIDPELSKKKIIKDEAVLFFKIQLPSGNIVAVEFEKDIYGDQNSSNSNTVKMPFLTSDGNMILNEGDEFRTNSGVIVYKNDAFQYKTNEGIIGIDSKGMIFLYTEDQIAVQKNNSKGVNTP